MNVPLRSILLFLTLLGGPGQMSSLSAQEASPTPAASIPPLVSKHAAAADVSLLRDLPYVTGAGPSQQLDLYLPPHDEKTHPLLVWIHGGGWESGGKAGNPAKALVAKGYVTASLNYRLSKEAIFPAQIEDCKAAIRWLRAHAAEYNIDPKRVGVWGASAGGHLVALLGTTEHPGPFDVGENLDQPSAVQCVVDWFGPTDFLHWGDPPFPSDKDTPTTAVAHLLGGTVATHQDAARAASPIEHVDKDAAPFLILHGDQDPLVPLQQSQELNAALQKAGVETTLDVLPGAKHGGGQFTSVKSILEIEEFLDRHLGVTPAAVKR